MTPLGPFEPRLVALRKQRVADSFHDDAFLHARAAEDLAERLEAIPRRFERILALGPGSFFSKAVAIRPDLAARIGTILDAVVPSIEPEQVNLGDLPFDLIVAPLALHWTNDLPGVLSSILRALAPDGLMLVSMLGGETLTELRLSLLEAEAELTSGAAARVSPFAQLQDLAALLQRAGFALPAVDRDVITVRYSEPHGLIGDLRAMGETSALAERAPPLRRSVFARAMQIYGARFADADGRVRATFEIITATGWAPHASQQKPLKPGSAKARLADALNTSEVSLSAPLRGGAGGGGNGDDLSGKTPAVTPLPALPRKGGEDV